MNPKILLVEDDQTLGFLLKEYLGMNAFTVDLAGNGAEGFRLFNAQSYDLCVLDIMMPAIDGFTLAELMRNRKASIPIIFLTAKSLKEDVIRGFKVGADDYIKKPVNEEELLARIHAVLRRAAAAQLSDHQTQFEIGGYTFESQTRLLRFQKDSKQLTEREALVLETLCRNKGELVLREYMLQAIWGKSDYFSRKSMDVFISRLRKYLSKDPSISIANVHGSGFVLSDTGSE